MVRLENIVPGMRLTGIISDQSVEVVATRSYGPNSLEVVWRGPDGLGERIFDRSDEPRLRTVSAGRSFAFDGDGHLFRLASEALRIRLAHLFDPYVAVNASRIEPLPHQLTAVYGVMLERQPLRFLLADDPGAGKTIMAGLLIKELLIRGSLERCLIIAPGSLVEQWQDELSERFDLSFDILSREQVENSVSGNPFADRSRLIARLDMLARNDELKAKLRAAPEWDLVIGDEAHRMSASFFGQEVRFTKRYQLGALAGELTRHLLLMTATPHNGKEEDFQLFMGLLDADRFEGRFREGVRKVDPSDMMRRMTKEELRRFDGSALFPERRAYTIAYSLSPREAELYEAVTHYVREEMNRADRMGREGAQRRNNIGFALQILQRRLASSPAAIHESLKRRCARLERRLEEEKLGRTGPDAPETLHTVEPEPALTEEDLEEAPGEEIETFEEELLDRATAAQTIAELEVEIAEIRRLETMALALRRSGEDTKWRELDCILDDPLVYDPARDIRRKIVIFTEARDTLEYLAGRIRARTGEAESVAVIHGGVPRDRRRATIAAFNDDPVVRFLLANDAAGEGVNLQRGGHLMVNYDLPWNPNRIEQRFGRIHRIGQIEVCHLWNLVASETREGAVYERLLEKLETARESLGGKVYDVLGELFEGRPLRELFIEAIRYGEKPEVRERLFQAVDGAVDVDHINSLVSRNKLTREGLDPATVQGVREDMERAAARRLQPHHIRSFFEAAFEQAGGVLRIREKGRAEITRVPPSVRDRDRLVGRGDPVLPRYSRICFDKEQIAGRPQAVLVAPGHPLLDAVVDLTLERYRELLTRGAVLIDENNQHDECAGARDVPARCVRRPHHAPWQAADNLRTAAVRLARWRRTGRRWRPRAAPRLPRGARRGAGASRRAAEGAVAGRNARRARTHHRDDGTRAAPRARGEGTPPTGTRPDRVGRQGADAPRDHASPAPCPRTRGRRACGEEAAAQFQERAPPVRRAERSTDDSPRRGRPATRHRIAPTRNLRRSVGHPRTAAGIGRSRRGRHDRPGGLGRRSHARSDRSPWDERCHGTRASARARAPRRLGREPRLRHRGPRRRFRAAAVHRGEGSAGGRNYSHDHAERAADGLERGRRVHARHSACGGRKGPPTDLRARPGTRVRTGTGIQGKRPENFHQGVHGFGVAVRLGRKGVR